MQRVRAACGPVGEFRMLNKRVVLLSGAAAQEAFCRAPDEQLSQKIAYRLMTPIFGEGVVFDAPPERLNEQLRILMPALRDRNMRTYADVFVGRGRAAWSRGWGEAGRDRPPRLHRRQPYRPPYPDSVSSGLMQCSRASKVETSFTIEPVA